MSKLRVNNLSSVTGNVIGITASLIPDNSTAFRRDIGSSAKPFGLLHVDNIAATSITSSVAIRGISSSVNVSGSIIPRNTNKFNLGSSVNSWKDLFVDGIAYIESASAGTASFAGIDSNLSPKGNAGYDLGASNQRWNNLYVSASNVNKIEIDTVSKQDSGTTGIVKSHGSKIFYRSKLASQLQTGSFYNFTLHNDHIQTDSVIVCNFAEGTNGHMSASHIHANVKTTASASVFIRNFESTIASGTPFTASFAVIG